VSRTYRVLLVAIVALGAVGGYWKLVLTPKREQIAQLDEQVAAAEAQLAQTQQLITTYTGARDAYKVNYDTVVRLGKAVPTDDDTRSLVVQLDAAAKRSGVDFDTVNVNGGGGAASDEGAPAAPGAVSAGNFSAMPFTFSFSGRFDTLGAFFARLERFVSLKGDEILVNGRLLRIERIQLEPGEGGWPALVAQVGASSYVVPEAADAPAPATGATTTSTTSTAAEPASGTTGTEIR
jgi:Tfp pilus assembly protein PilO